MTTSLQQQLQRLAVPQTTALVDTKSKASILFDRKEAATKSRRIIYDLGVSGLQELIAINANFQQFELTLFEETTLNLERSVELKEVNELLDRNIKKFLQHLAPYFLLRPAHLCLEWLLRRFQVHEYNRNELLALALPYHETNTFVRVLQTIRIRENDAAWAWLRPIQKPGLHLPKTTIVNRAATDPAFLNFICKNTTETIRELSGRAHTLQTHINFYATVIVGALDNCREVAEWHITTILPSLLQGLSSQTVDFTSAAYIISGQLMTRTQLTPKLCNAFINRIAVVNFERLRSAAVLLLIWIFDSQQTAQPKLSERTLVTLTQYKWLIPVLAKFAKDNVAIHSICEAIVVAAVRQVYEAHADSEMLKGFLERLLNETELPKATAERVISCFLDSYIMPVVKEDQPSKTSKRDDVIELSDEEMCDDSFNTWYSEFLRKLERKYPEAFDLTIKLALRSNMDSDSHRRIALKMAMSHRLKSFDQNTTDIYECLYHYNASMRVMAVQKLLQNLQKYRNQPQNFAVIRECLADRILDDNEDVIAEILALSTDDFVAILGCEQFVEALFKILYNITGEALHTSPIIVQAVRHLTHAVVVNHYDSNLLLLALMPLLFPNKMSETVHTSIALILSSALADKVTFLGELQIDSTTCGAMDFRRQFLDVITKHKDTPTVVALFQSLHGKDDRFFRAPVNFAHFLLLVTACLKQKLSSAECHTIFQQVYKQCKRFRIKLLQNELNDEQQFIPLQLFSDFVLSVTTQTSFALAHLLQWSDTEGANADLLCFLNIFDLLAREAFEQTQAEEKSEWAKTLKDFFEAVFRTPQEKLEFLCNFYTHTKVKGVDSYAVLQLRAFKILSSVVRNKQNDLCIEVGHIMRMSVALCSGCDVVRQQALLTMSDLLKHRGDQLKEHIRYFITSILERYDEISMDWEQYPLVLYLILQPRTHKKPKQLVAQKLLREFMSFVQSDEALHQSTFTAQILKGLKHFNDEHILKELLPLGLKVLDSFATETNNVKILGDPYNEIFMAMCARFEATLIHNLLVDTPDAWTFVEETFHRHDVFVLADGKLQPLPCVLLDAWDEHVCERMPSKYSLKLLRLIISTVAKSENDIIFLTANKLLKKCMVDCQPLVDIIEGMCRTVKVKTPQRKTVDSAAKAANNVVCIEAAAWKEGIVLLELLENKKKLSGAAHLVAALFELLKLCLEMEEQSPLEYTKQLALSALLHCCRKSKAQGIDLGSTLPKSTFRIDQIVQCMRATQNPQTHHNALMLLSYCATMFPQQVLHNIVDIFTFMGSSVVRQDDSYSFHIINNIIESIIPIVVNGKDASAPSSGGDLPKSVIPVLKVFSDIILDVPEHRRQPLYMKLLDTLGAEQYLWAFLCVVFESNVLHDEKERQQQKKAGHERAASDEKFSKRVKICFHLTNSFPPETAIETCVHLMDYVKTLPVQTSADEKKGGATALGGGDAGETSLFDVKVRSAKQLRHYRYVIMQFLSAISSSPDFLAKIETLNDEEVLKMKSKFQNFIIKTLSYAPIVNEAIEKADESIQTKYWKVILHHLHDTLDNAISLLSPNMFLVVINGLMQHQLLSIRRKVIELLISKLQRRDSYFDGCDHKNFHNLLKPLSDVIAGVLQPRDESNNELVFLQQTAMIAIKLLSKMFALTHIEEFKALLCQLIAIAKKRAAISKILLATAILTIIEISANLKAHSLAYLPKYMPHLIQVLRDQAQVLGNHAPDNVCIAIIAGIQKLFEALPLFLGPFIVDIITPLSTIWSSIRAQHGSDKDQRCLNVLNKITATWERIAHEVPLRVLVPSVENAYKKLMAQRSYAEIEILMKLLPPAIGRTERSELATLQNEITNLFLQALQFRAETWSTGWDKPAIANTELVIIEAFVAWVLKLSESSFRPLYSKVYEWALRGDAKTETILTYFRLTNKIAEALKSLFVLFAGSFIDDAAKLLNAHNTAKQAEDADFDVIHSELLNSILGTLHTVFLHDSKGFINQQRFEVLHQPIVDQLENRLVLEDDALQTTLSACLAQLSMAVSNDILWKQLNYQVLLKTRTNVPEVRILAFNCCVEIARKLGEEFTPLLPETVPFIAELFEDENPRVEKNTRKAVQELEGILGESLQKYL